MGLSDDYGDQNLYNSDETPPQYPFFEDEETEIFTMDSQIQENLSYDIEEEPSEYHRPPQKKKSNALKIGLILGGLVIIAIILVVLFVFPTLKRTPDIADADGDKDGVTQDVISSNTPQTTEDSEEQAQPTTIANSPDSVKSEKPDEGTDEIYEDGKLVKQALRDNNGVVTGWVDFAYFDNGFLREKTEFDADANAVKQEFYLKNGTLAYYLVNEYDSNGNKTLSIKYNKDDIQETSFEYLYDNSGMNTEIIEELYDKEGALSYRVVSELFSNGFTRTANHYEYKNDIELLTETKDYNRNGSITMSTLYEYDEEGLVDKKIEYEYDREGKLVILISEYDSEDVKTLMTEFDYDENGEETEHRTKEINNSGVVTRTRFFHPGDANPYRIDPPLQTSATPTPEQDTAPPPPPNHGTYNPNQDPYYVFDANGNILQEIFYYSDGAVHHYVQHVYNDEGKMIDVYTVYP